MKFFAISICACLPAFLLLTAGAISAAEKQLPNFVVIFCDDLGYGDLGCFGNPTIRTPHLDRMATEGMKSCLWIRNNSWGTDTPC